MGMGSRRRLRRALIGTIWAPCVLSGCTVGPDYVKPTVATPAAYKEAQPGSDVWKVATPSDSLKRSKWWEIFGDAQLNALTEQVNVSNQVQATFRPLPWARMPRAYVNLPMCPRGPTSRSAPLTTS